MKHLFPIILLLMPLFLLSQPENEKAVIEKIKAFYVDQLAAAGGSIAVIKNGEVLHKKAFGIANFDYGISYSTSSVQDMATLTMHMTAAAILKLEHDDKLNLGKSIQTYLPDFPQYKEGEITIQNLLNHTSGIRDYIALILSGGKLLDDHYDNAKIYKWLQNQKALCIRPGSEYRFSQSNYVLLALIVEKVCGQTYAEYLNETFFTPFQMSSTTIYDTPKSVIINRALAYETQGGNQIIDNKFNYTVYGDGRIYSSLDDMIKWITGLKNMQLGDQTMFEKICIRGKLSNGKLMTYANGIEHGLVNGREIFAHNGYFGAHSSMLIDFPEEGLTIITTSTSSEHPAPGRAYDFAEWLFPPEITSKSRSEASLKMEVSSFPVDDLEQFTGNYFIPKYGYVRQIYIEDDTLILKINDEVERKLVPLSPNTFSISGISIASTIGFEKINTEELKMTVQVGQRAPLTYTSYSTAAYNDIEKKEISGTYHSDELDVTYELTFEKEQINVRLNGRDGPIFIPIMKGKFTSEHDGFLSFTYEDEKVIGFILNDYSLGSIRFSKAFSEDDES